MTGYYGRLLVTLAPTHCAAPLRRGRDQPIAALPRLRLADLPDAPVGKSAQREQARHAGAAKAVSGVTEANGGTCTLTDTAEHAAVGGGEACDDGRGGVKK